MGKRNRRVGGSFFCLLLEVFNHIFKIYFYQLPVFDLKTNRIRFWNCLPLHIHLIQRTYILLNIFFVIRMKGRFDFLYFSFYRVKAVNFYQMLDFASISSFKYPLNDCSFVFLKIEFGNIRIPEKYFSDFTIEGIFRLMTTFLELPNFIMRLQQHKIFWFVSSFSTK